MRKSKLVFLSIFVAGLLIACGNSSTEQEYIERAQTFFDTGDTKSASIELKNALNLNIDNGQAHLLLGQIGLKTGNYPFAKKELLRAKELGFEGEAISPDLGVVLLALGENGAVLALQDEGLSQASQANVLASKALAKESQGSIEEALSFAEKALVIDKASTYARIAKASILLTKKDVMGARALVDEVLNEDNQHVFAWNILASIEVFEKHTDAAISALTNVIKYQPTNWDGLRKRALLFIQLQDYAKAQSDVSVLLSEYPKNPLVQYLQGLVHFYTGKFSDAANSFDLASAYPENLQQTLYYSAVSHFRLGHTEQAEGYAIKLNSSAPDHVPGVKLLAAIKLARGEIAVALDMVQTILKVNEQDIETLNLLARIYVQKGENKKAIDVLSKVVELEPESEYASTNLGVSLLLDGQQELGLTHLQKAIKLNPKVERADVAQVMFFLKAGKFEKALIAAENYRQRNPSLAEPLNLIGVIYSSQKKMQEAIRFFNKADELDPGNTRAGLSLASIAINEKKYQHARQILKRILEKNENHFLTLMKFASLDVLEKKDDLLVEHLQKAISLDEGAIAPRLLIAKYYLSKNQYDLVLNSFDEKMLINGNVLALRLQAQLAMKSYAAAKITSNMLVKVAPQAPQTYFLESQVYAGLGEYKTSNDSIVRALDMDPRFHPARIVLARQYLLMQRNEQAKKQIRILERRIPKDPNVMQLVVTQYLVSGESEKALGAAKALFNEHSNRENMQLLVRQYLVLGDKTESINVLKAWIESNPADTPSLISIANHYIAENKLEPAVEYLRKVIKLDSKNISALNNLAWYLRKTDPKSALVYAESAHDVAPNSVRVMDTYSMVLLENGEVNKAVRIAEKALSKNSTDPVLMYHAAMIQSAAGSNTKAVELLKLAVESKASYPELEAATQLLKELAVK